MTTIDEQDLTPELQDRLARQLETWRRDLLALDRRQRLLYFKHTRTASLELIDPGLNDILAQVEKGRVGLAVEMEEPDDDWPLFSRTDQLLLVGEKSRAELRSSLRRLDQHSQQVYADRGLWTLYLGLGMLQWVDADDERPVCSPVLLVPVRLHRDATHHPYRLSRTEDEPVVNPALRLKLEQDFALTLPEVDEYAVDLPKIIEQVETAIAGRVGWGVHARAVLTTFSFHKEAIYRDLLDHHEQVAAHPLVQLVALGPDAPSGGSFTFEPVPDEDLDATLPPEKLLSILDADGSQRKCILAARDGRSFVMDGPPGTGKSQTIANIMVELMATGRTVLFVSEKAAALDVVRKRLADADLGEFLLELHSHAATRKQVVHELDRALTKQLTAKRTFTAADESALVQARVALTDYAQAMNETRPGLGRSLHEVLGRLAELHELADFSLPGDERWRQLDAARLAETRGVADGLQRSWRPVVEGADFLWREVAVGHGGGSAVQGLIRSSAEAGDAARKLAGRCRAVDADLGLSFPLAMDDVTRRVRLLDLAAQPIGAPTHWLTRESLDVVDGRIADLRVQTETYLSVTAELSRAAGAQWQQLDGDRLSSVRALLDHGDQDRGLLAVNAGTSSTALSASLEFLTGAPQRLLPMADDARRLAAMFGMNGERLTPSRAAQLAELASIGSGVNLPEPAWLNAAVLSALADSASVLHGLVGVVQQREQSMSSIFTRDALDLDLTTLHARFRDTHVGWRKLSGQARADKRLLRSVSVSGKCDKTVLAHLEEAAAWQHAERALTTGEQQHAERLGGYYVRTETHFGRLAEAIAAAHRAVRLAGEELNSTALGRQVARGGSPDPSLVIVGERLASTVDAFRAELVETLGEEEAVLLEQLSFSELAQWCADSVRRLREGADAVVDVAATCGRVVTVGEAVTLLEGAADASLALAGIFDAFDEDRELLGPCFDGVETDWGALERALAWAKEVQEVTGVPVAPSVAAKLSAPTLTADDLRPAVEAWDEARGALTRAFDTERAAVLAADLDSDLVSAAEVTAEMATSGSGDIELWHEYVRARHWLEEAGLEPVVGDLASRRADTAVVADAIERAVLEAWVDATVLGDDRLRTYRANDRDALVDRFQELDRSLVAEAHAAVVTACCARRPKSLTGRGAQLIRRQAQLKTRHLPIRELLDRTAEVAQELKPCFMMSPLTVSQYLPASLRFDVVIFDEASQVLPSDAINCIYRGSQLIVAGDQKQLPPTSFFTSTVDDDVLDDEEALDTFQSVLDLCKGAGALPSLPLTWHYRSRHEALITYSNYRFYDGGLRTFPGAAFDAPDVGVEAFVVPGVYRRGGARDNPIEAEEVVERILHHRGEHPNLSLGVVTFSSAQEDAVRAAVEHRAEKEPALAALLTDQDRLDGFFVKNLENVQGDERDIIIFSIGYGRDENGKLTMNFGPLNRDLGWRRLNVAITRARRRVEVISSFRPAEMTDTQSQGVRHLRGYLDFALRGEQALALDLAGSLWDAESPFEEDVLRVIRSWGYDAVPQVGAAGYRIDIGVRHPDRQGEYLLAVECDGAAYHSAKAARDRDRLRESVLRGLGWNVHRIWGISWVRDRAGQMQRLRAALEDAMAAGRPEPPAAVGPARDSVVVVEEVDFDAAPEWAVPYQSSAGIPVYCTWEPGSPEARPELRRYFERLLAAEAPVHEEILMGHLRQDWGIGRVGHLIKANARQALSVSTVGGSRAVRDQFGFYRLSGQRLEAVRVPGDADSVRPVGHMPPEELELAVKNIVRDGVLVAPEQLGVAVARLFGWRRQTAEIQGAVGAAVSRSVAARELEATESGELRVE